MMWGRWQTFGATELPEKDRRERARIVVNGAAAILLSAPIFNVGEGDPYQKIEILSTLGPDALPYRGKFNREEFVRRLFEHKDETIGAALLNQRIVAGLGNYLRAEILFACKLNPWLTAGELTQRKLSCLSKTVPRLTRDAYKRSATASEEDRKRMASDPSLVYQPGREYGTRHMVFRRTNLPCLRCGEKIRQLRQKTIQSEDDEEERTRIVYFCAKCQATKLHG
jgi:formamidopyrimidine-DNA glycosylase